MKRLALVAIAALALLSSVPLHARAQTSAPFYTRSGATTTTLQTVVFGGFQGQGTCSATIFPTGLGSGQATIAWGLTAAAGFNAPALYNNLGQLVSSNGVVNVTNPGTMLNVFWACPNVGWASLTQDNSVGLTYSIFASTQAWPWAGSFTATPASPAPAGLAPCGFNDLGAVGCIVADASAPLNISTLTTTTVVAAATGKTVYVMGYNFSLGSGVTAQFASGTGVGGSCSTPAMISGPLSGLGGTSAVFNMAVNLAPIFKTQPPGAALCLVTGGTAASVAGVVSYAQF